MEYTRGVPKDYPNYDWGWTKDGATYIKPLSLYFEEVECYDFKELELAS